MHDRYVSFFTIVLWLPAGLLFLIAVLVSTPLAREVENRPSTFVMAVFLALMFLGGGYLARGSRSHDQIEKNVREASLAYNRSVAALQALPLTGTEGLLASCREASITGKSELGGDMVRCKRYDGKIINFRMPAD